MERNERINIERDIIIKGLKKRKLNSFISFGVLSVLPLVLGYGLSISFFTDFINNLVYAGYIIFMGFVCISLYSILAESFIMKLTNLIILRECDPLLVKEIVKVFVDGTEERGGKYATPIFKKCYFNTLIWLDDKGGITAFYNDHIVGDKTWNKSDVYRLYRLQLAYDEKNEKEFLEMHSILKKRFRNNDTQLRELQFKMNVFYACYEEAYEMLQDSVVTEKVYILRRWYRKGECLHLLDRTQESIPMFQEVIQMGGTTHFTKKAQAYLSGEVECEQTPLMKPVEMTKLADVKQKGTSDVWKFCIGVAMIAFVLGITYMLNRPAEEIEETTYIDLVVEKEGVYMGALVYPCEDDDHMYVDSKVIIQEKIIFGGTSTMTETESGYYGMEDQLFDDNGKYFIQKMNNGDTSYYYGIVPFAVGKVYYEGKELPSTMKSFKLDKGVVMYMSSFMLELDADDTMWKSSLTFKN